MNIHATYLNKLERKNYSANTIQTYLGCFKHYMRFCSERSLDPKTNYEQYILWLVKKNYSLSSQNQAINAIKFYLEKIEGMDRILMNIDRPRKEKRIPEVLSKSEVKAILGSMRNVKHHAMLSLIYACGLRVGELINLKITDINGKRKLLHIKKGKGFKDRSIPIPESVLIMLRTYYKEYKPVVYMFEGQPKKNSKTPTKYSNTSLRLILKRALIRSGIKRRITLHTLRHSYATHMYEHGIELRSIQVLLGHSSSRSTEIYTHVATKHLGSLPSPIDFLDD